MGAWYPRAATHRTQDRRPGHRQPCPRAWALQLLRHVLQRSEQRHAPLCPVSVAWWSQSYAASACKTCSAASHRDFYSWRASMGKPPWQAYVSLIYTISKSSMYIAHRDLKNGVKSCNNFYHHSHHFIENTILDTFPVCSYCSWSCLHFLI